MRLLFIPNKFKNEFDEQFLSPILFKHPFFRYNIFCFIFNTKPTSSSQKFPLEILKIFSCIFIVTKNIIASVQPELGNFTEVTFLRRLNISKVMCNSLNIYEFRCQMGTNHKKHINFHYWIFSKLVILFSLYHLSSFASGPTSPSFWKGVNISA